MFKPCHQPVLLVALLPSTLAASAERYSGYIL